MVSFKKASKAQARLRMAFIIARDRDAWKARANKFEATVEMLETRAEAARQSVREPAVVTDGSGYAASLRVLPSFGCALHEERKGQEVKR